MKINLFNSDPNLERFSAGQAVFREDDQGDFLFAVVNGAVDIITHGKTVETVEAGSVTDLVRIDRKRFLFLVQQTPFFAIQLMGIMAERLRRMNERL